MSQIIHSNSHQMSHTSPSVRPPTSQGRMQLLEMVSTQNVLKEGDNWLLNLYMKLSQEMESVIQGKVCTEITLNQKGRQLGEALKVIQGLKTDAVEQHKNLECMSQNFMKERSRREQIMEQVTSTHHMCETLTLNHKSLKTTVEEFRSLREFMKNDQDDTKEQIKSLTARFEALGLKHRSVVHEITYKANMELDCISDERNELRESLKQRDSEVDTLKEKLQLLQCVESECGRRIFSLEDRVESLTARCNWISDCFEKAKASGVSLRTKLEETLVSSEHLITELRENLEDKCIRLTESRNEFEEAAEKVEYLKRYNEALQGNQEELLQQLQAVKSQNEDMKKSLHLASNEIDEIMKAASEDKCTLQKENLDLENKLKRCRFNLDEKVEEKEELLKALETASEESISMKRKFEDEKLHLDTEIRKITMEKQMLSESVTELQEQAKMAKEEIERERAVSAELKKNTSKLEKKLSQAEKKREKIHDERADLSDKFEKQSIHLKETLENEEKLKASLESYPKELKKLQGEIEEEQRTCKELTTNLNAKQKTLKYEQKKNEKLEKKLQTMQLKLNTNGTKSKEDLRGYTKTISELKAKVRKFETERVKFEAEIDSLKKQFEKAEKSLMEQLKQSNKAKESAEENAKECIFHNQDIQMKNNSKIKEVTDLIESGKRESESVLQEKNNEISNLKQNIEALEISLVQTNDMKKLLEVEKKEQNEMISTLQEKNVSKCNELNELKAALKRMTEDRTKLMKMRTNSPLRTPSPSEYLPLFGYTRDAESNTFVKVTDDRTKVMGMKTNSPLRTPSPSQYLPLFGYTKDAESNTFVKMTEDRTKVMGKKTDSPLRTPSPSQYLPLFGYTKDAESNTFVKTKEEPVLSLKGILRQRSERSLIELPPKSVTFRSPVIQKADSDSSDGINFEIESDEEDPFEALKKPSQIHQRPFDHKKSIPRADVHPIPRIPFAPLQLQQQTDISQPAIKRTKFDRSVMKTYGSPRILRTRAKNENIQPKETMDYRNTTIENNDLPLTSQNDLNFNKKK